MADEFRESWLRGIFKADNRISEANSSPDTLINRLSLLPPEQSNRRATLGNHGISETVSEIGHDIPSNGSQYGPRYWANKFLRKPRRPSLRLVSANLDAFFECFSAHHAIIDPLTGRFNLSPAEYAAIVGFLLRLESDSGGLVPVGKFTDVMLAEKWSFTSKGVLSLSVCQRVIHLARIYAVHGQVNVPEFIDQVLRIRKPEWVDKLIVALIKTVVILLYYVAGCLFYGYYMGLTVYSSIYFITCTISTLGPGDIIPIDDFSRLFTLFYSIIGIVLILGIITGEISTILASYQERVKSVGGGIIEVTSSSKKRRQKIVALYTLHIFYAVMLVIFPVAVGTVLIYYTYGPSDSMSLITCIYTAAIIAMSIGYGDFVPETDLDRMLICVYIFLGISCVSAAIVQIGGLKITINAYKRQELLESKRLAVTLIAQLDSSERGVNKFEFLAAMLVALEKVGPREIAEIIHQFDEMDSDNRGIVSLTGLLEAGNRDDGLLEETSSTHSMANSFA